MKKILTIILTIGLIMVFVACDNKEPAKSGDSLIQSGDEKSGDNQENNNQENNNQVEGTLLSIEGNATTGYTWHITSYDTSIIKVEELGTESLGTQNNDTISGEESGENTNLVGAPTLFKFKITGVEPGVTDLVFDYYRSWEGSESAIETRTYVVTVDNLLNVIATEKIEEEIPSEDDFIASEEMETLVNTLITNSGVQFPMPATSKILLANAPTFVGLPEDVFSKYVVDSVVYEPMISPATSSLCIVKLSDDADIANLKQTVLDNSNPAKWICTGAEQCLVIESGRYIMLVMSTPDNCNALATAFKNHFGADNVGEVLTKEGISTEGEDFPEVL